MNGTCANCAHKREIEVMSGVIRLECWRYPPTSSGYPETKAGNTCGEHRPVVAPPEVASPAKAAPATRVIKGAPVNRGGKNGR